MILPSKHISEQRALLTVGANLLKHLDKPKTVSAIWEDVCKSTSNESNNFAILSYDWFILALDLLYAIDAVEINEGLLTRRAMSV